MVRLNNDRLVKLSVSGEISHPTLRKTGYVINSQGQASVYPSVGGIAYNVRIGDLATGWMADHVEPGVSIRNTGPASGEYSANAALNVLACIGNKVQLISGEAKGEWGLVTGKHGGVDHVIVDFQSEILDRLQIGDKVLIRSFGVGLRLLDYYPDVLVMNLDPGLIQHLPLKEGKQLEIAVTHIIPAKLMGAGIGSSSAHSGDYDIQILDEAAIKQYSLNELRLGDIIAITDSDSSFGWVYREGAITIGVVAHSNSVISGHGPGVVTILTSAIGRIKPFIDKKSNIKNFLSKIS
jgi:Domain of unknown function (DUF4438), N-terminal/Domain of unknown function (DUF4438), C-terminal